MIPLRSEGDPIVSFYWLVLFVSEVLCEGFGFAEGNYTIFQSRAMPEGLRQIAQWHYVTSDQALP